MKRVASILLLLSSIVVLTFAMSIPDLVNHIKENPSSTNHLEELLQRSQKHPTQFSSAGFDPNALRQFINDYMSCAHIPGLAVGIVKGGQVIFQEGFGKRDGTLPVDNSTLFGIGSTTKAFTVYLLGQLKDAGLLDWDERVSAYLPGFRLLDPAASDVLTVRDVLSHRSGLPRHDAALFGTSNTTERSQIVYKARFLEPTHSIREKWQYNNWMVTVGGFIAEAVLSTPWEDLVQNNIFDMVGMNSSVPSFKRTAGKPNVAVPAAFVNGAFVNQDWSLNLRVDNSAPAGSINSNIQDMLRWANHLLGHTPPGEIAPYVVSAATVWEMMSASMHYPSSPYAGVRSLLEFIQGDNYGMGWQLGRYPNFRGFSRVWHGGDVFGMHALVSLIPAQDFGVVLLTNAANTNQFWRDVINAYITDAVFGLTPLFKNASEACAFDCRAVPTLPQCSSSVERQQAEARPAGPASPLQKKLRPAGLQSSAAVAAPTDFVNVYSHPAYGTINVTYDGALLYAKWNDMDASPLQAVFGDRFSWSGELCILLLSNCTMEFSRDSLRRSISLTLLATSDVRYRVLFTSPKYGSDGVADMNGCPFFYGSGAFATPTFDGSVGPQGPAGTDGSQGQEGHVSGALVIIAVIASILTSVLIAMCVALCVTKSRTAKLIQQYVSAHMSAHQHSQWERGMVDPSSTSPTSSEIGAGESRQPLLDPRLQQQLA